MKIDVSDEVYRKLQLLARPFEDTPNDVISRLLNGKAIKESGIVDVSAMPSVIIGDIITKGGSVPAGTKLKARYKSRTYLAEIANGRVVWDGKAYSSLSDAAVAVIQSTGSNRTTEDGWRFWFYLDQSDNKWKPLYGLRTAAAGTN